MGQITFGGLASGLDTNAIIEALVQLERRPIELLQSQRSEERSKVSEFGKLEALVKTLQDQAEALTDDFFAFTLNSSSESTASFTLSAGAQAGSHSLEVLSLAKADVWTFQGVADPDAQLGAGTITFDYDSDPETSGKESFSVTIEAGSESLNDIAASINSQAGDAVTASVINAGTALNPSYQLVLTGNDTGEDFNIENLAVSGPALTIDQNATVADNADIVLDGIAISRSSNVFSDVLAGVSFTVSEVTQVGTPVTFTVNPDAEGVKANIQEFVDAYNGVIDFINAQNEYDEETGPGGDLFGDSALSTVRTTIQNALFNVDPTVVANDPDGYSTLGLVGVELDSDGRLSIDDTLFDSKLKENPTLLGELFTAEDSDPLDNVDDSGLLLRLTAAIEDMVEDSEAKDANGNTVYYPGTTKAIPAPGIFSGRKDAINEVISDIDDQIERLELHVSSFEEDLILRFSKLEALLSGLNSQAQFLNAGFGLPAG